MAEPGGELLWFSPDPRGILSLEDFYIPHGLERSLRKRTYEIRINTQFQTVMSCCAQRKETWIDQNIFESYVGLHELGYAHSVEAWDGEGLAGGLYGVSLGGVFFGESMFHHRTDASKYALVALVDRLRTRGFGLLDIQWTTAHLDTFGAIEISRQEYMERLKAALLLECDFIAAE